MGIPSPKGLLSLDLQKTHSDQPSKTVLAPEPSSDPDQQRFGPGPSLTGCRLKIMEVSHREKFVRILNQSSEDTADLGGLVLKQLVRDFPVCTYRFPPGTLLAPQHHITVWGEGPGSAKHRPRLSSGHQRVHLRGDSCRVTLLLSPGGEILSEHQVPRCVAPVSETFADNTDLSIDCFPLSDTCEQPHRPRPPRKARVRGARGGRRRPGTRGTLPLLSARKFFPPRKVPAPPEGAEPRTPEPLPAIPGDPAPGEDRQVRKETKVRVCRKRVDPGCPMVALSVQTTAESRYGFRFLSCPPVTADKCRRA
ncbi:lamin tail domain-containing protein 2-like [Lemur catta]|uniref:lamin tail domain-containing protein 2-like n=1 Tax=Lemur catta TaxID=9447 RepID=UPI001E26BAAE|nr:lamin tail domain-containing protein 2-like [Lemur catta]